MVHQCRYRTGRRTHRLAYYRTPKFPSFSRVFVFVPSLIRVLDWCFRTNQPTLLSQTDNLVSENKFGVGTRDGHLPMRASASHDIPTCLGGGLGCRDLRRSEAVVQSPRTIDDAASGSDTKRWKVEAQYEIRRCCAGGIESDRRSIITGILVEKREAN